MKSIKLNNGQKYLLICATILVALFVFLYHNLKDRAVEYVATEVAENVVEDVLPEADAEEVVRTAKELVEEYAPKLAVLKKKMMASETAIKTIPMPEGEVNAFKFPDRTSEVVSKIKANNFF